MLSQNESPGFYQFVLSAMLKRLLLLPMVIKMALQNVANTVPMAFVRITRPIATLGKPTMVRTTQMATSAPPTTGINLDVGILGLKCYIWWMF
jgi:hypothetical protein